MAPSPPDPRAQAVVDRLHALSKRQAVPSTAPARWPRHATLAEAGLADDWRMVMRTSSKPGTTLAPDPTC